MQAVNAAHVDQVSLSQQGLQAISTHVALISLAVRRVLYSMGIISVI